MEKVESEWKKEATQTGKSIGLQFTGRKGSSSQEGKPRCFIPNIKPAYLFLTHLTYIEDSLQLT